MKITALGHSCLVLSFGSHDNGDLTRILVDPWLSDHAVGDAMGRYPRLRFETADLGPIHAVYLSHAHCDHLDPYTLLRLWRELPSPPVLILPVSLAFLVPVFEARLPTAQILLLAPFSPVDFRGVELMGIYDVGPEPTNEDDVMVLVLSHGGQRAFVEADARLSLELPRFRAFLSELVHEPGLDTVVWLTTENELAGTMAARDCVTQADRVELRQAALEELHEEVHQLYAPTDDPGDLWQSKTLVRLVHGQGLAAAPEQDPRWQRVLFPVRTADRIAAERAVAEERGCRHSVAALTVGAVHTVEGGRLVERSTLPWLALLDRDEDRKYDVSIDFSPDLPWAPLRAEERDRGAQSARILAALNDRFLPHLHGQRSPPVLHLLADHGGEYRIQVHFGVSLGDEARDYVLSFGGRGFVEQAPDGAEPQETYWANDLEDVLDGRCDEFSTFWRRQLPVEAMRLWVSLATPLLNSDLVAARVERHFERAAAGMSPGSWVVPLLPG
jgi:L-ascorbate metabolism protein UlaG (beta-lactamase superfamily)